MNPLSPDKRVLPAASSGWFGWRRAHVLAEDFHDWGILMIGGYAHLLFTDLGVFLIPVVFPSEHNAGPTRNQHRHLVRRKWNGELEEPFTWHHRI